MSTRLNLFQFVWGVTTRAQVQAFLNECEYGNVEFELFDSELRTGQLPGYLVGKPATLFITVEDGNWLVYDKEAQRFSVESPSVKLSDLT